MEAAGDRWWPIFGAVYMITAIKRVHGHAPDRPGMEQETRNAPGARPGRRTAHSQRASMTPDSANGQSRFIPTAPARAIPAPAAGARCCASATQEKELFGGEADTTNNRMELMAVIEALEALKRPCQCVAPHRSAIRAEGHHASGSTAGRRNGWKTAAKKPVKNDDLWKRLDALVGQHQIEWRWVKGHAATRKRARRRARQPRRRHRSRDS